MLKKLRILISAQHALMLAYRSEIYLWVLAHILPFIMMSVWMTAAAGVAATAAATGAAEGGKLSMNPVGYSRYFLAVFIIRQFSTVWMIYEFEWHIVEGRLSYLLLRPLNALWHYITAHLGEQLARFPFFVIVVVFFFCIYPQALWLPTPFSIVGGICAIYAAFALRFAMQYCVAMLTFWFERASSLEQLNFLPYLYLSGLIIPLTDLPKPLASFLMLTPFPYCVAFPAWIMTGQLTPGDPQLYSGICVMLFWFLLMMGVGAGMWKRGLLRYSGQGA